MKKSLVGLLAVVLFLARPVLGANQLIVNGFFSLNPPSTGWEYDQDLRPTALCSSLDISQWEMRRALWNRWSARW